MKKWAIVITLAINIGSITIAQTYIPPGNVTGTWFSGSDPYLIQGDITIPNDSTLIIEPDVVVVFEGHYAFNVQGRLLAIGNELSKITFTIEDTTGFHNPDIIQGGWNGIQFIDTPNNNDTSKIIHCILQFGKAVGSNPPDNSGGAIFISNYSKVVISNSLITHNSAGGTNFPSGGGISLHFADIHLIDNVISHNRAFNGGAASFVDCDLHLNNCDFSDNASAWIGGGLNAYACNLEIINSTFERDTAFIFGGAMGVYFSELDINNSVLTDNRARILGGGIHSDESNINISNTTFIRDTTGESGGAIFNWLCQTQVQNCDFIENSASNGGAISVSNSDLLVDSCLFSQNLASNEAGAIECFIDTSFFTEKLSIQIINSNFIDNNSANLFAGVKIRQDNSDTALCSVRLDKNLFKSNTANSYSAIRVIGNIDDIIVSNSIFEENFAAQFTSIFSANGGAKVKANNCVFTKNYPRAVSLNINAKIDFMNCTFANNYGMNSSALSLRNNAEVTLTNSILWNNGNNPVMLVNVGTNGNILTVNYSDIQFGPDSLIIPDSLSILNWGIENFALDPLFVDTLNNDFHLQDLSPCIATGIDSIEVGGFWHYCPSSDIEGNPRPNPAGSMPDVGAYESEYPVRVGDEKLSFPKKYVISQNFPNPFNPSTKIRFAIPDFGFTTLKVYDVLGNKITTLVNEELPPGEYEVDFSVGQDSSPDIASGIYFYQLVVLGLQAKDGKAGKYIDTKKMILIK